MYGDLGRGLGQLTELDLRTARWQVEDSRKRASRRQARLQFGGELRAARAHELRAEKAELKARKLAATEARVARQAINRARNQLKRAGIEARKEERARKNMLTQLYEEGLPIPPELELPIPDPEHPQSESEGQFEGESERGSERGSEEVIVL
ncbi:hypothetical protein GMDG_05610 [Pseudogymnoascus destructans 20631-21]|uniref:Uncharacterized protein n=1 Tax=Pseudogymnoascus destructans (strain ATCC MYA-4855 / 20631-21) TaxID=658429 RepID=L8FQ50_PSED2|nr:hypothetical protein GMDG_05610 [Pseudogymnoascus destructans 20631-21]